MPPQSASRILGGIVLLGLTLTAGCGHPAPPPATSENPATGNVIRSAPSGMGSRPPIGSAMPPGGPHIPSAPSRG